ncbi:MAG: lipoyl(octanoyl) transferase, partial [Verrucomicrobia bacterium]|nr:lipoyl(octanoyl) transferase [Verrucomicrobiota bacterium]
GFDHIVPCGLAGITMTSLSRELGREISIDEVKGQLPAYFERTFG